MSGSIPELSPLRRMAASAMRLATSPICAVLTTRTGTPHLKRTGALRSRCEFSSASKPSTPSTIRTSTRRRRALRPGRAVIPTEAPAAPVVSAPSRRPSPHVTFSGLGSSTGKCVVATISKSLFLVVLGGSTFGLAQQPTITLESLFHSAQQAQASGDFTAAVDDYTQAAKMRPDMPVLWANLGLTQQEASNIPAAIEAFQHANRLDPSLFVPNLFLGIDYAHSGRAQQAIPFLIRAGKTNPSDAQAPLALGRAYIAAREYSEAIPELNRVLHLDPKLSNAWFDLGIAQLDQVESDARTISIENKQSPFAGALYAESLGKHARFGEAASLYKSILDSKPQ